MPDTDSLMHWTAAKHRNNGERQTSNKGTERSGGRNKIKPNICYSLKKIWLESNITQVKISEQCRGFIYGLNKYDLLSKWLLVRGFLCQNHFACTASAFLM
jgi:hypothetical protein